MHVVNEGALHSDRSKISVAFYLRARSIRGRVLFQGAVYSRKYGTGISMVRSTCAVVTFG